MGQPRRRPSDAEARGHLTRLVEAVTQYINELDALMDVPPSHERGQKQAQLLNGLEIAKDVAERFGLGKVRKRVSSRRETNTLPPARSDHPHSHGRSTRRTRA